MMRSISVALLACSLLEASAMAQGPITLPTETGPSRYECPDPPEFSEKPVCCRVTMDLDAKGNVLKSTARCTHPAYEAVTAQCQAARPHGPATQNGKPIPYRWTYEVRHSPSRPKTPEEFSALWNSCKPLDVTS